jgi:hypothetical protein
MDLFSPFYCAPSAEIICNSQLLCREPWQGQVGGGFGAAARSLLNVASRR